MYDCGWFFILVACSYEEPCFGASIAYYIIII